MKILARNKRAHFDYHILETLEVGLVLTGSEVKSLRRGRADLTGAFVTHEKGELYLMGSSISPYAYAYDRTHEPGRPRKLLLHKRQIRKWIGHITQKGNTLVPLDLHFNTKGLLKSTVGVAKGKKTVDKREAIKERDWQRQKQRLKSLGE